MTRPLLDSGLTLECIRLGFEAIELTPQPSALEARGRGLQLTEDDALLADGEDRSWNAFRRSLSQAMVELNRQPATDGVLWVADDPFIATVQSFMSQVAVDNDAGDQPRLTRREVTYDDADWLGWARSLFEWWRKLRPAPFRAPKSLTPLPIANDARLALFGDWGSGRYGAPVIAHTIAGLAGTLDATIHLGDTYYAGTPEEIRANLLGIWPHRNDSRSLLLNGNHERYGGDIGYYEALDELRQDSSYFALQNDHFLILGLDSAYRDCDLGEDQPDWVERQIAAAGERRVILLSHHQPFSAFEAGASAMVARLRTILEQRRIFAWYWGHEHRCVVYDAHPLWGTFGRCLGHGGYPYFRVTRQDEWARQSGLSNSDWYRFGAHRDAPGGIILGDDNPYVTPRPGSVHTEYGAHGFAFLTLDGPNVAESILRPDGEKVYEQVLNR
jgi:hypothetical protein